MTKEIDLQHNVIFNTVCLTVKEGPDFENAYQELVDIAKLARKEPGCIAFTPAPGNFEKRKFSYGKFGRTKPHLNHMMPKSMSLNTSSKDRLISTG